MRSSICFQDNVPLESIRPALRRQLLDFTRKVQLISAAKAQMQGMSVHQTWHPKLQSGNNNASSSPTSGAGPSNPTVSRGGLGSLFDPPTPTLTSATQAAPAPAPAPSRAPNSLHVNIVSPNITSPQPGAGSPNSAEPTPGIPALISPAAADNHNGASPDSVPGNAPAPVAAAAALAPHGRLLPRLWLRCCRTRRPGRG